MKLAEIAARNHMTEQEKWTVVDAWLERLRARHIVENRVWRNARIAWEVVGPSLTVPSPRGGQGPLKETE